MKKIFPFIVFFLLSLSLVAAVEVSTSKTDYNSGETVTATITDCVGTAIVEFKNPNDDVVDIKSGEGSWSTSYNSLSDSADGMYTATATCTNDAGQGNFCVDAPGCLSSSTQSTTTSGSGGGSSCSPDWSCDSWSFCGPTLTQTRSCIDLKNCQAAKDETRECEPCLESWVCSLWAECNAETQNRACYDEHFCETSNLKPGFQKGCNEADPVPPPARISAQLPPPFVPSTSDVAQQSFLSKAWNNYKVYLLGVLAVIVLAILVLLAIHIFAPKKIAYNINELKQWVRKEKEMGTAETDIRNILKQNTGWTDEEISMAFEKQQPSRTVNNNSV